jgi:hypothetical protein
LDEKQELQPEIKNNRVALWGTKKGFSFFFKIKPQK